MSTKYPIEKFDKEGNRIYYESSNGLWFKYEYDKNRNLIYNENSNGWWRKSEYDKNRNLIYNENSNGDWRHGFFYKITRQKEGIIIKNYGN